MGIGARLLAIGMPMVRKSCIDWLPGEGDAGVGRRAAEFLSPSLWRAIKVLRNKPVGQGLS